MLLLFQGYIWLLVPRKPHSGVFYFNFNFFKLKYSWLTMLCWFQVYGKMIQWFRSLFRLLSIKIVRTASCAIHWVKWKSLSHVQLCDPMGYTVHGILQARILEWVASPFSSGSSQPRNQIRVSCTAGRFLLAKLPGKPVLYSGSLLIILYIVMYICSCDIPSIALPSPRPFGFCKFVFYVCECLFLFCK